MSLYMESRVTMLLSEVYIFAPIKTLYLPLENSEFCVVICILLWKLTVTFILCVKSIEETCEEDESGSYCHSLQTYLSV